MIYSETNEFLPDLIEQNNKKYLYPKTKKFVTINSLLHKIVSFALSEIQNT